MHPIHKYAPGLKFLFIGRHINWDTDSDKPIEHPEDIYPALTRKGLIHVTSVSEELLRDTQVFCSLRGRTTFTMMTFLSRIGMLPKIAEVAYPICLTDSVFTERDKLLEEGATWATEFMQKNVSHNTKCAMLFTHAMQAMTFPRNLVECVGDLARFDTEYQVSKGQMIWINLTNNTAGAI